MKDFVFININKSISADVRNSYNMFDYNTVI